MTRHTVRIAAVAGALAAGWSALDVGHGIGLAVIVACCLWGRGERVAQTVALILAPAFVVTAGLTELRFGRLQVEVRDGGVPAQVGTWLWAGLQRSFDVERATQAGWLVLATIAAALVVRGLTSIRRREGSAEWRRWWPRRGTPAADTSSPLAPGTLAEALVRCGVLRKSEDGLAPRLTCRGKITTNEYGSTATYALPPGVTLAEVQKIRAALASHLHTPAQLLRIYQADNVAPNVVTFWIGKPLPPIGSGQVADVVHAESTCWADGVRIGRQLDGTPLIYATRATHTGIFGATRSGKTVVGHNIAAAAMLDPTVKILVISGKSDSADWDAMAGACEMYIGKVGPDTPAQLLRMFAYVEAYRVDKARRSRTEGRAEPGMLLIIEEWSALRSSAGTEVDELDKALARLLATSSSAGIQVVLIAQRATATNIPTDQSGNVMQRLVFKVARPGDVALALSMKPEGGTLPTRKGQVLISDAEHGERFGLVDYIPDEEWETLCARAIAMRNANREPEPDPVDDEPEAVVAPLLQATIELLEAVEGGELEPAQVHDRLPDDLRGGSSAVTGRRLSALGLTRVARGQRKVYTLPDALAAAVSGSVMS